MKRPKLLSLGPFSWKVGDLPADAEEAGTCSITRLEISLRKGDPQDLARETLFHELIHAALFASGHSDSDKQERWVTRISPFLYQALRDDPLLRSWLFE